MKGNATLGVRYSSFCLAILGNVYPISQPLLCSMTVWSLLDSETTLIDMLDKGLSKGSGSARLVGDEEG